MVVVLYSNLLIVRASATFQKATGSCVLKIMEQNSSQVLKEIKSWITPALLSFVSMMLYQDMQEMKSDIKTLLNQNAQNEVRIHNLENRFQRIEDNVYNRKLKGSISLSSGIILFKEEDKDIKPTQDA